MSEQEKKLDGPDFARGVPLEDLAEGSMILGQAAGEAVVLARAGGALFAIGAECTHYHGPLAEGMLVADTVRCPWHHACFSLRTGEALRAPALDPVACWRVDQQDGKIYVRDKLEPAERGARTATGAGPDSIVIIGGGAAGNAAAEMLRREGYSGPVTMLSADDAGPRDWVQRRGAQRLSGAETEAGVVPRATDGIRHQHPLGEWAVGALRADREERSTG